jgi:small subunit ribosomal protein S8
MDHIANLIIKIKNAGTVGHPTVTVPFTKLNEAILKKLQEKGYVKGFSREGKVGTVAKFLEVELAYDGGKPKISDAQRISKLSRRVYEKSSNLRSVRQGYGLAIISTPKGILTDSEARKARVGGEVLFKVW